MYKPEEPEYKEDSFNVEVHEIKSSNKKKSKKKGSRSPKSKNTQSKAALQTDRPSEQSAIPYPETKPVQLAVFEKTDESVELVDKPNFNLTTKSLLQLT